MAEIDDVTLPAFRYLAGESENICRLCFSVIDGGVYIDESRLIECHYYDDTITFAEILIELGADNDPSLPQKLCECCADAAMNSFLFQKLCQKSHNKWHETITRFNKTLDLCNEIGPTKKTAFILLHSNVILTSRIHHKIKTKEEALGKIRDLMHGRKRNMKNKKKLAAICEECGEKFASIRLLEKHTKIHTNKKYFCKHCPKVYQSQTQLRDHLDKIHKPKTIQCPKCPKMFSTEKIFKAHDSTHHKAAICKHCFIQFPSKKDLQYHSYTHYKNKCPKCDKVFLNKRRFSYHITICGRFDERQLKICDICNKSFTMKHALKSHLTTAHGFGPKYPCKWCKKPFDAASKLRNHIVKHTRERNFYCDQCGGQFVTHAALVYHIRIHTGERPYPCDICEESFLSASRRMEHKRRKHWGPSRECPVCHCKFVTRHELTKHVARHKNPESRLFVAENEAETNHSTQKRSTNIGMLKR